jgi:DNA-binding SARP family transcriptional activator
MGDGTTVHPPRRHASAILAYLALHLGTSVSREEIVAHFWPDSEPEKARQNLRQCVKTLRTLLEQPPLTPQTVFLTDHENIRLNPAIVSTDVVEFEALLQAARQISSPVERARPLGRVVGLYRGDLLPGFYQDCFALERHRLGQLHLQALQELTEALEAIGDLERAADYARQLVSLDPLREESHGILMRLYSGLRMPAAVQRQYLELQVVLAKELEVAPSEETRLLAQRLCEAACKPVTEWETVSAAVTAGQTSTESGSESQNERPQTRAPKQIPFLRWAGALALLGTAIVLFYRPVLLPHARQHARIHHDSLQYRPSLPASEEPPAEKQAGFITRAEPQHSLPRTQPRPFEAPLARDHPATRPVSPPDPWERTAGKQNDRSMPVAASEAPKQPSSLTAKPEVSAPANVSASEDALWEAQYPRRPGDSNEGGSEPSAMTLDPEGNLYVAGFVRTQKTDVDYLTLKYSPTGKLLWERRYNGPSNDVDRAKSIAVDSAGNVYVTGESDGGKGHGTDRLSGLDIATIKYDRNGKEQWVRRYAGPADGRDSGHKIAVDRAGGVFVFGQSWNGNASQSGGEFDLVTIKYSPTGTEQWVRRYPGANSLLAAADLVVTTSGEACITGSVSDTNGTGSLLTLKFSSAGEIVWEKRYAGAAGKSASAVSIALDRYEDIVVGGYEATGRTGPDGTPQRAYLAVVYDRYGKLKWGATYPWGGYGFKELAARAVPDGYNNVYVTGTIYSESVSPGCGTLRLASDGALTWADPYRSPGHRGCVPTTLALNSLGEALVVGWCSYVNPITPTTDTIEMSCIEYTPDGKQRRIRRLHTVNSPERPCLAAIDMHDNLLVCGCSYGGSICLARYRP